VRTGCRRSFTRLARSSASTLSRHTAMNTGQQPATAPSDHPIGEPLPLMASALMAGPPPSNASRVRCLANFGQLTCPQTGSSPPHPPSVVFHSSDRQIDLFFPIRQPPRLSARVRCAGTLARLNRCMCSSDHRTNFGGCRKIASQICSFGDPAQGSFLVPLTRWTHIARPLEKRLIVQSVFAIRWMHEPSGRP